MAKQQSPKSGKTRNDDRKNGKANKKRPGARGSRKTPLDEGMKIMLGGGMFARWDRLDREEKLVMKAKERKKRASEPDDE